LRDSAGLTPAFPFSAQPFGQGHLYTGSYIIRCAVEKPPLDLVAS